MYEATAVGAFRWWRGRGRGAALHQHGWVSPKHNGCGPRAQSPWEAERMCCVVAHGGSLASRRLPVVRSRGCLFARQSLVTMQCFAEHWHYKQSAALGTSRRHLRVAFTGLHRSSGLTALIVPIHHRSGSSCCMGQQSALAQCLVHARPIVISYKQYRMCNRPVLVLQVLRRVHAPSG